MQHSVFGFGFLISWTVHFHRWPINDSMTSNIFVHGCPSLFINHVPSDFDEKKRYCSPVIPGSGIL